MAVPTTESDRREYRIDVIGALAYAIAAAPDINIYNPSVLDEANQWLRNGNKLIICPAPHTSIWDSPILLQRVIYPHIYQPKDAESIGWYTSVRFTNDIAEVPTMGTANQAAKEYARMMNFSIIPAFPKKLQNRLRYSLKDVANQALRINLAALRKGIKILQRPSSMIGIFPEASRGSTDHGLMQTEPGMDLLLKSAGVKVMPIVLAGIECMQSREDQELGLRAIHRLNPFVDISVQPLGLYSAIDLSTIAESLCWRNPLSAKESVFTLSDAAMWLIAQQLPVEQRGIYTPDNIIKADTL